SVLKARNGGQLPQPTTSLTYTTEASNTLCYGCGEPHLRKHCPHRQDRCAKCSRIGHISRVCKAHIIQDNVGNPRLIVQPSASKVRADYKLDKTNADHVRHVKNFAGALEEQIQRKAQKARERSQVTRPTPAPKI